MNRLALLLLLILLASSITCQRAVSQSGTAPSQPEPHAPDDLFVEDDTLLRRNGYELKTFKKNDKEISYAALTRFGKEVGKFDGVYHPAGNSLDCGLYDLFGHESPLLIVSMTVFRGGRHWVARLDPEFRVLFDSNEYGVGREEFEVVDIDNDGIYEISLPVTAFYEMQDKMYIGEIPLPEIVFKYDPQQQKYLPANALYLDYAMRGLDAEMRKLDQAGNYLSRRLRILLLYIYAGKETEGWAFFDAAYQQPDKVKIKATIQSVLNDQPVYKYLKAREAEPLKHHPQ